ncbi:carboxylesterase BioH (pimeloyl-CoA synthesis) [Ectothiorhodosinus mongolicus]|uniref:Pimeloyl-[acyl-carrier protein] methyl ester esterase n=1 Tax=Ectothiorhodosinus mongolicus TaxID=233100 RepID=A0A1R3VUN2_9GAMM|nr:pimeloyl-ACP methyl ester esterase BioH [Ectothiorhodosinus mongolicus]ULX56859.1 pimeloyl-[acyl-carrier protein] methyl ester esterase [Ectothiorhodosinus mongolicus]SIT68691.1 carboxylesterase BioH (pimeloyl-CoA synthesis) [Ectothiorhodosinus mongolicus]
MTRRAAWPLMMAGQGEPLMLVHGWGMSQGVWAPLLPHLAKEFECWAVDLPGHGTLADEARLGGLEELTERLLSFLPPQPTHLLLWSMGALPGLELARRHPERIASLTLVAATPRFTRGDQWPHAMDAEVLSEFAENLQQDYRATLARFLALQSQGMGGSAPLLRQLRATLAASPPAPQALREGLQLLRQCDLRQSFAELSCPCAVLLGEYDRLVPGAVAASLKALRADLDVHIFPGLGHAPFLSQPQAFAAQYEAIWRSWRDAI